MPRGRGLLKARQEPEKNQYQVSQCVHQEHCSEEDIHKDRDSSSRERATQWQPFHKEHNRQTDIHQEGGCVHS